MTKKRWFRFYIDQWFKGSFGLSPNEVAAYITILCELYDNDGIVALDVAVMSRRCGMRPTSFQKALDALIERKKVSLEAGLLTQNAVSDEIRDREKLREKSSKTNANRAEKRHEIKAIQRKTSPYTDNQNNKGIYSTTNVEAAIITSEAMRAAADKSPALAGFLSRRKLYGKAPN